MRLGALLAAPGAAGADPAARALPRLLWRAHALRTPPHFGSRPSRSRGGGHRHRPVDRSPAPTARDTQRRAQLPSEGNRLSFEVDFEIASGN